MTLADYLRETNQSCSEFGAKCRPAINRITMWRIKRGDHNPGADKVAAIEKASGYRVRAQDLLKHKNRHVPSRKVANP